jgi:hypothetical protein
MFIPKADFCRRKKKKRVTDFIFRIGVRFDSFNKSIVIPPWHGNHVFSTLGLYTTSSSGESRARYFL